MYQIIHYDVKCYLPLIRWLATLRIVMKKKIADHKGTLNIRDIPKDTIFKLKMAAAAEHRTVKGFILSLIEERIQELEKKGVLPKGKG